MIGSILFSTIFMSTASAYVDPACQAVADQGTPDDYSEVGQGDYLLNFFSLATTFSSLHGAIPGEPGTGSMGLEIAVIPPLSCERRLVLNYTKTEDTNKAPAAPRPRISFTFPQVGNITPYAGLGYVPPVTVFGTRNVIISGELGMGLSLSDKLDVGGRYHATMLKTIAEIATPFEEGGEAFDDLYVGSTFGVDLIASMNMDKFSPYIAVGFTDVSTFFYIGDDGIVQNNTTPYAGLVSSVGTQYQLGEHIDLAAEFYTAPGYINTGRLRGSWSF
jgi:hypothetical protein